MDFSELDFKFQEIADPKTVTLLSKIGQALAKIYSANKNDVKAKEILNGVMVMVPEYGEAKSTLAEIFVKEGDLKSAKENLAAAPGSFTPSREARNFHSLL